MFDLAVVLDMVKQKSRVKPVVNSCEFYLLRISSLMSVHGN